MRYLGTAELDCSGSSPPIGRQRLVSEAKSLDGHVSASEHLHVLLAGGCGSRSRRPLHRVAHDMASPRASEPRECAQVIHRGAKGETTAFHELILEATCPHSAL